MDRSPDSSVGNCSSTQDTLMPDSETDQFFSHLNAQSKEELTEKLQTKVLAKNDDVENQGVSTVSVQGARKFHNDWLQWDMDAMSQAMDIKIEEMQRAINGIEISKRTEKRASEDPQVKNSHQNEENCAQLTQELEVLKNEFDCSRATVIMREKALELERALHKKAQKDFLDKLKNCKEHLHCERREKAMMQENINSLLKTIAELKQKFYHSEENQLSEREAEKTTMCEKMHDLEVKNNAQAERIASLEEKNEQQRAALEDLKAKLVKVETERDASVTKCGAAKTARDVAITECGAAKTACDVAITECGAAKTARDVAIGEVITVKAQRDVAQGQLVTVRAERDAANGELATTKAERDGAKGELVITKAERDAAKGELVTVKSERDAAKGELATVKPELDRAKGQLVTVKAQRNAAICQRNTAKTERDVARARSDHLNNNCYQLQHLVIEHQQREQSAVAVQDRVQGMINELLPNRQASGSDDINAQPDEDVFHVHVPD